MAFEELALHQRISDAVAIASLDVDSVVAEIDYERAQTSEIRNVLSTAQNRKVNLLSFANIVAGTGSGILTNAMQFKDSTAPALLDLRGRVALLKRDLRALFEGRQPAPDGCPDELARYEG